MVEVAQKQKNLRRSYSLPTDREAKTALEVAQTMPILDIRASSKYMTDFVDDYVFLIETKDNR